MIHTDERERLRKIKGQFREFYIMTCVFTAQRIAATSLVKTKAWLFHFCKMAIGEEMQSE